MASLDLLRVMKIHSCLTNEAAKNCLPSEKHLPEQKVA